MAGPVIPMVMATNSPLILPESTIDLFQSSSLIVPDFT